jgi:hypothetical protein
MAQTDLKMLFDRDDLETINISCELEACDEIEACEELEACEEIEACDELEDVGEDSRYCSKLMKMSTRPAFYAFKVWIIPTFCRYTKSVR